MPREPATLKRAQARHLFNLLAVIAALTVVPAAAARADAVADPAGSERNFAAVLHPVSGAPAHAIGVVLFRQPHDTEKVVFLDVWTLGLTPNHSYSLQRATDSIVDDNCQGTNWLTLGRGLEPQAIETNERGFGRAHLFRDLASLPGRNAVRHPVPRDRLGHPRRRAGELLPPIHGQLVRARP
jgi:hypothetical protein